MCAVAELESLRQDFGPRRPNWGCVSASPPKRTFAGSVTARATALPWLPGVTPRAVVIGLLLIPATTWWLAHIEHVRYSDNATTSAIFFHCLSILLVLVGVKALLRRFAPRWELARGEILTVYIMLVVTSALAGHDQLQIIFLMMTWVFRNATPENHWEEDIFPHLPRHLLVDDPLVLRRLYGGEASLYDSGLWQPWVGPVLWWVLFAGLVVWTQLCLMAVFRRQWDRERLNYPIAQVPLDITAPAVGLLRHKAFWAAFTLAAAVQLWRLANNLWPAWPPLNVGVFYHSFREFPLSAMGAVPLSSYPFSYGLAYLLPLNLAFSVWFFFWFARLEMVVGALIGHRQAQRFPYIQQQGVGAYFGLACFILWAARDHLAKTCRAAWGDRSPEVQTATGSGREPLPSPVAVWGFWAGVAGLIGFSLAAGASFTAAVLYFAIFLTLSLVLARLRAELGLPTIELYQVGADDILPAITGSRAWSPRDKTVMAMYFWLHRTHRQLPMPIQADAFRIGHEAGIALPSLGRLLPVTAVVAALAAFWAYLHVVYQTGVESAQFADIIRWAFGRDPWQKLGTVLNVPRDPDYGAMGAYAYGIAFTLFLASMRTRFVWWPFHPVGYLVSGSFGLFRLWLPIFITWLFKAVLLRYGGLETYRRARPFFLGLISGEFSAAFLRTVVDLLLNLHLPPSSGVGGL